MIMSKCMISQPMNGLTDEEILINRSRAIELVKKLNMGYEIENAFLEGDEFTDDALYQQGVKQYPVYYLAKSIEAMSKCRAVFFCKGWEQARGCRIEHQIASSYGLKCYYE